MSADRQWDYRKAPFGPPITPWNLPGLSARIIHPKVAFPNQEGKSLHEMHAATAESRLDRDGIKAELLAYLAGIGAKP